MQHESQALFKACIHTYLMAIFSLFWFIIMRKPIPEKIDLTEEDANQLIERISASNLSCDDIKIVIGVIHFCLWLQTKLVEAKITIRKLSKFFGVCSEKRPINNKSSNPIEANDEALNSQPEAPVL